MKKLYVLHNDTIMQREQRYSRLLLASAGVEVAGCP